MLTFVGSEYRGSFKVNRSVVLREMEQEAARINPGTPSALIYPYRILEPMPNGTKDKTHMNEWYTFGRTPKFYETGWNHYRVSNFSWQPHGDSSTRNALYESVMFGCIPVIDTEGAYFYRRLFKGLLWNDIALEDFFVVLPKGSENDAKGMLKMLQSMSAAEIDARRNRLRLIAPELQWGSRTPNGSDALQMALRALIKSTNFSGAATL